MVEVTGQTITVTMAAQGLLADNPHAAHIHFGAEARHECPVISDDTDGDGHLDTTEGGPAYGPVVVSLTKTGDTSAASTLAVDRYDTAKGGKIAYQRGSIKVSSAVAHGITEGKSVVVIHGVDHNHDGKYNGSKKSDLDPSLPTEATDPALCGALHVGPQGGMATGDGGAAGGMNDGLIVLGGAGVLRRPGSLARVVSLMPRKTDSTDRRGPFRAAAVAVLLFVAGVAAIVVGIHEADGPPQPAAAAPPTSATPAPGPTAATPSAPAPGAVTGTPSPRGLDALRPAAPAQRKIGPFLAASKPTVLDIPSIGVHATDFVDPSSCVRRRSGSAGQEG